MIKATDLTPIKNFSEIPLGGTVYRKDDDGFHNARYNGKSDQNFILHSFRYIAEGRLFRRINKPWHSFE